MNGDPREILTRPGPDPDMVVRYADHDDGLIDVFAPPSMASPGTPYPLVVMLHGGFWRAEFDRHHLRPLAQALTQRGRLVAVPEFRRTGAGGEWPNIGSDVEAALSLLPAVVDDIAPGWVERDAPYVLAGHSAGGHLAMWAGLRAGAQRLRRIVALAPVSDLAAAADRGLGDGAVLDLLGGTPGQRPDTYAAADPLRLLPGDVPVSIIQGADDVNVPATLNRAVIAEHPEITYVELDGVEHFALIDPLTAACRHTVLPALGAA